jgi:hypothetical protein
LWHFTSTARAAEIDRLGGWLLPGLTLLEAMGMDPLTEGGRYVWLISEANPAPRLVGFRDTTDHLAVRYQVVRPEVADWWPRVRHQHDPAYLATLEAFALPSLWWVAREPVRVVRDAAWTDPTALLRGLRRARK